MMKSENRMSKDVVKRRLNSLFGDYSEFIKPTQQQRAGGDSTPTNVKVVAATTENSRNIAIADDQQQRRNESQQQELLMNGTGGGEEQQQQRIEASSSVDNMIEIMDIPRPISPVQSTSKMEIKQEEDVLQSKASTPKCLVKSWVPAPADLDAIINQISFVSPLLSPIRMDIFNTVNGAAVAGGSAETTTSRKRPNSGEEVIKAKKKKSKRSEEEQPAKKMEEKRSTETAEKRSPKAEEKPSKSEEKRSPKMEEERPSKTEEKPSKSEEKRSPKMEEERPSKTGEKPSKGEEKLSKSEEKRLPKTAEKRPPKTEEKPSSSLLYSIKLAPPTFKKLLQRLDDQKKKNLDDQMAQKLDDQQKAQKLVDQKPQKLVDQKAQKLDDQKAQKLDDQKAQKLDDQKAQKLDDQKAQKLDDQKAQKLDDQKAQKLDNQKAQKLDNQKTKKNCTAKLDEPKPNAQPDVPPTPTSTTKNSNKQSKNATPAAQSSLNPVETKCTLNVPTNTKKSPFDYFTGRGRELRKRAAENEKDKAQQILLSFESIAYYIMASTTLSGSGDKLHQSIADNTNRINSTWSTFKRQKMPESLRALQTRLKYLQMMISACLAYQLYSIRSNSAFTAYSLLAQYEKENPVAQRRPGSRATVNGGNNGTTLNGNGADSTGNNSANGATTSTTTTNSSPAASTPGSLNSQATVIVPVEIYNALTAQNQTLHHLMWSFKLWNDAKQEQPADCKKFMDRWALVCGGELRQNSELVDVAEYLLTAVYLLRQEFSEGAVASTTTESCNNGNDG